MEPISDNNVRAAPAANTPLRRVAHDKLPAPKLPLYLVWYAFLADPANKHASAPKKFIQEMMKKTTAKVVEVPLTRPFPKQRHLVTPLSTVWLIINSPNAVSPYTVDASVPYTQYVCSSYSSGTILAELRRRSAPTAKTKAMRCREVMIATTETETAIFLLLSLHLHTLSLSLSLSLCFPKMSSVLDMSLDDIIGKNKRMGGQTGTFRGRGRGSSSGAGPTRRFPNRVPARASPYSTFLPVQVQRQVWQPQLLASEGYGAETGTKLYISNLDYGVSNEDIKVLFSEVGQLKHYSIHYDRSGRSKGTAEVQFLRQSDALAAIKRYNNVQLDGKAMKIELVGVNLVAAAAVPPTSKGILGNPNVIFRSTQERIGTRGSHGGGNRGVGRGRGRGKGHGEKKSAEDLDAELEKYHLEAMQIS